MSARKNEQTVSRAAKRARFSGQRKSGASPWVLIIGLVVAIGLIGGTIFALTRSPSANAEAQADTSSPLLESYPNNSQEVSAVAATHGHDPFPLVLAADGAVRLALSTFDDYKAHYYTYMHEGRPIEFFVLKSKEGVVRAAFNACDVCFLSKKGYTQDGDEVVCNNCGRRFPADQINVVHGGCNPSPLARQVENDTLVILVEDIVAGQGYF